MCVSTVAGRHKHTQLSLISSEPEHGEKRERTKTKAKEKDRKKQRRREQREIRRKEENVRANAVKTS